MTRLDGTPRLIVFRSEDIFRDSLASEVKGILSLESTFQDSYVDKKEFYGHPRLIRLSSENIFGI